MSGSTDKRLTSLHLTKFIEDKVSPAAFLLVLVLGGIGANGFISVKLSGDASELVPKVESQSKDIQTNTFRINAIEAALKADSLKTERIICLLESIANKTSPLQCERGGFLP